MKYAKGYTKILMKNEQASALDVAREKVGHSRVSEGTRIGDRGMEAHWELAGAERWRNLET